MYTLQNFYQSKEWARLLNVIKMERVNKDGQIICERCGRPIIHKYDCIGHHITLLTEDNVNDFNISLNPTMIQLLHHSCHNRVHDKLGYTKREVYLVYGSPLSGKSTYVKEQSEAGDLIIDIDRIWECVSGQTEHTKPARLNAVVFGLREKLMEMVKYRVGRWNNAYIVGGYPMCAERERICKETGAREIFIDTPKETCLERLDMCNDRDKEEYREYIEQWHKRYTKTVTETGTDTPL